MKAIARLIKTGLWLIYDKIILKKKKRGRTFSKGCFDRIWEDSILKTMRMKVHALAHMKCRALVNRPARENMLHSKFALKEKMDGKGVINKYEAHLVVYGGEEDVKEESFSRAPDFIIIKLVIGSAKPLGYMQSTPKCRVPFLTESWIDQCSFTPKRMYKDSCRRNEAMKLNQSLYRLYDAASIWDDLIKTLR